MQVGPVPGTLLSLGLEVADFCDNLDFGCLSLLAPPTSGLIATSGKVFSIL